MLLRLSDRDVFFQESDSLHSFRYLQEFLTKNQKRLLMTKEGTLESQWSADKFITAAGKDVIVIGGGDIVLAMAVVIVGWLVLLVCCFSCTSRVWMW